MGKSKSIAEEQQKSKEFNAYIDQIRENMRSKTDKYGAEFGAKVKDYYGDEYPRVIKISAAERYDFRQQHEVTLDTVKKAILDVVNAIFPGEQQDKSMDKKAKEAVDTVKDFRSMAAAVATNLIMGAMNILSTSSEVEFNYGIKSESICPGLTLHVLVANGSYKDKRWFQNTGIVESYIRYELIFSYKRVQVEMDINYFNSQLAAIGKLEAAVNVLKARYAEALLDPAVTDEQLESMEKRISLAEETINDSRRKVKEAINVSNVQKMRGINAIPSFSSERKERIAAYIQSAGRVTAE